MSERDDEWIDISVPLRTGMVVWPGDAPPRIERLSSCAAGDAATLSLLTMTSHTGTHVDAPAHFVPGAATVDALPLSTVIGPARVLDIPGSAAISADVLARHDIGRGERILLRTRNSRDGAVWRRDGFAEDFVALDPGAARYLAKRRVRLVGVDYLSVSSFGEDPAGTHRALLEAGVWILEGLDLTHIAPGDDYELVCLPLLVAGGDGAPARAALRRAAR